jgi:hypothetical protein
MSAEREAVLRALLPGLPADSRKRRVQEDP